MQILMSIAEDQRSNAFHLWSFQLDLFKIW